MKIVHHRLSNGHSTLTAIPDARTLVRVATGSLGWHDQGIARTAANTTWDLRWNPGDASDLDDLPDWGDDEPAPKHAQPTRPVSQPQPELSIKSTKRAFHPSDARLNMPPPPPPLLEPPRPAKRRRLETTSVFDIITEPHQHHSPTSVREVPAALAALPQSPVKIYLHDGARDAMQTPHKRVAWVIPLRGRPLRHDDCTLADIVPDDEQVSQQSRILWHKASIRAFWGFLAHIREQYLFGSVGYVLDSSDGFDFIKVYHSASRSLQLRLVLDSFRNDKERLASGQKHYRPLKGVVLLLVDEASKELLLA